jgi:4-hydroxy-2-oxoheptanedioate aldolase
LAEYRINKAKEKLQAGGVISIVNGVNDGDTAEIFGNLGFDAILAEGEHGPISWDAIGDISRACDLWNVASVVRVHRNDPALVTRALDRGANGIMVPHVNTLEEAELVARSSYYGPEGNRGAFGGRRALGITDFHRKANENTLVTILLEDIIAIRNMEEIVKADGIDVFYVAPGDLAQSMGHTGDVSHPEVLQAVEDGLGVIIDAGRVAGTLVNDDTVQGYIKRGVRCVGMAWQPWLAAGATSFLGKIGVS